MRVRQALSSFFLTLFYVLSSCASTPVFAATGPLVNGSPLTITAGGAWQALFTVNSNRSTLWIQNPCSAGSQGISVAESLFVAFGTKPVTTPTSGAAGVFELSPCGSLVMDGTYNSQQAIWVYGATTAHAFEGAQTQ